MPPIAAHRVRVEPVRRDVGLFAQSEVRRPPRLEDRAPDLLRRAATVGRAQSRDRVARGDLVTARQLLDERGDVSDRRLRIAHIAGCDALLHLEAEPVRIDPSAEPRSELVQEPTPAHVDARAVADRAEGMEGGLTHLVVPLARPDRFDLLPDLDVVAVVAAGATQ